MHQLFGEDDHFFFQQTTLNPQLVGREKELNHLLGRCPIATNDESVQQALQLVENFNYMTADVTSRQR